MSANRSLRASLTFVAAWLALRGAFLMNTLDAEKAAPPQPFHARLAISLVPLAPTPVGPSPRQDKPYAPLHRSAPYRLTFALPSPVLRSILPQKITRDGQIVLGATAVGRNPAPALATRSTEPQIAQIAPLSVDTSASAHAPGLSGAFWLLTRSGTREPGLAQSGQLGGS